MSEKTQASMSASELKKQIKEMEDKKRRKILQDAAVINVISPEGESDKVSFDEWWMLANKKVTLKPWMKEIVAADFAGRGLSKKESIERYNHALRQFGYSI